MPVAVVLPTGNHRCRNDVNPARSGSGLRFVAHAGLSGAGKAARLVGLRRSRAGLTGITFGIFEAPSLTAGGAVAPLKAEAEFMKASGEPDKQLVGSPSTVNHRKARSYQRVVTRFSP